MRGEHPGRGRFADVDLARHLHQRGQQQLFSGAWWLVISTGATLVLIALSINLFADWLRDALNPRLR